MKTNSSQSQQQQGVLSRRVFAYVCVVCLVVSTLAGVLQFSRGFFPSRALVPSASAPSRSASFPRTLPARFSRLVFVVIDALRSDFVSSPSSAFSRLRSVIGSGRGVLFEARAAAPTVTLPRLRAIVTGASPTFADVVRNVATSDVDDQDQDSFVATLARTRRAVLYGDDTWLRLVPRPLWRRVDPTTSFFVTDTVEVDANVTRGVTAELGRMATWDVLVAHYLGVDHIGHLQGPGGPLMRPKIAELDAVIGKVFDAADNRTLIVVLGDHGMSKTGNHGGSSPEELSTALAFLSPGFEFARAPVPASPRVVSQVDVCPTVSLLCGVAIPKDNTGGLIPELFSSEDGATFVRQLEANAAQVRGVIEANSVGQMRESSHALSLFDSAQKAQRSWAKKNPDASAKPPAAAIEKYTQFLAAARELLAERWGNVDWYRVTLGTALMLASCAAGVFILYSVAHVPLYTKLSPELVSFQKTIGVVSAVLLFVLVLHMMYCTASENTASSACVAGFLNYFNIGLTGFSFGLVFIPFAGLKTVRTFLLNRPSSAVKSEDLRALGHDPFADYTPPPVPEWLEALFLLVGTAAHALSLFGSSFVEEEQQVWYFLVASALIVYFVFTIARGNRRAGKSNTGAALRLVLLLAICRLVRSWNSTGARGTPLHGDIAGILADPESPLGLLSVALAIGAAFVYTHMSLNTYRSQIGRSSHVFEALVNLAILASPVTKLGLPPFYGIWAARAVFGLVALSLVFAVIWPRINGRVSAGPSMIHLSASLGLLAFLPLLLLLAKRHNMLLIVVLVFQAQLFAEFADEIEDGLCRMKTILARTVVMIWLSRASFFALGNSNSISTIDLSGSFAGLTSYSAVGVALESAVSLYTGPIIFGFFTVIMICRLARRQRLFGPDSFEQSALMASFVLFTCQASIPLMAACLSLVSQHTHLFVWSVFAPKFIYSAIEVAWVALLIPILLASGFLARSQIRAFNESERKRIKEAAARDAKAAAARPSPK